MKKRYLSVALIAVLLLALFPLRGFAAEEPYFIAINDELPDLGLDTEPIRVNGETYLPCTVFDRRIGGAALDVYYAWDVQGETVSIYSKTQQTLEFNIKDGTAYSYDKQREYNYQAVVRSGMAYVPAAATCSYFDLDLTFPSADDADLQILRIKNEKHVLDDQMFLRSARSLLEDRSAKYNNDSALSGTQPGANPVITPNETPEEIVEESESSNAALYLAMRVDGATELTNTLNVLADNRELKAVFFFSVDRLTGCDELLREIVGHGHRVGLIPSGDRTEEKLASLERGNELLKHILRQKAIFVLAENASAEWRAALHTASYLPWTPTVAVSGAGRSDSANQQAVLERLEKKDGKVRLLLDDTIKSGALSGILSALKEKNCDMQVLRETDY